MSLDEPKTIAGWTRAIAMAIEVQGLDSASLFHQADISPCSTSDPDQRIEASRVTHLMRLAVEVSGNPAFGLLVARQFQPTFLHALGFSLYSSTTLHDVCVRLARYSRLVSDNISHSLLEAENCYMFKVELVNPNASIESLDGWVGAIIQICRQIYRPDFSPLRIELVRSRPLSHAEDFEQFFGAPVSFAQPANVIYFTRADMHEQLPSGSSVLSQRNDEIVIEYLARLDKEDIVHQVEDKLLKLLPTGDFSKTRVADLLNMSRSKLHNKLEEKNTSYQEILEALRSDLARKYIEQNSFSFSEVAYLLGFTDTSNFSRAFRRWTGMTPSQFKDRSKR
ncbi:AraC family transcriptional regulator [Parahaliea maris]|uniref:AraC family transcriptional regulator n=1 Tax=Parahaliea maris TaxID=2716870 RepID=A0A5C8ZZX6_9GAMM|nr:AraC family transcriptional regulator [Parahaliea maris]TXS92771.1 AraC family transcriptional regulator [Parahaliea maris]